MRKALVQTLVDLAEKDPRVLLLTGDLGFMVMEPFIERFPERFFNVGVAEQNMVGVATGLAEGGYIPFVYSIITFATLRPYEFIVNGPIAHQLPVRIVGVGGGFEYGAGGPTHHGLEDLGVMRTQPGITVLAPADYRQARAAVEATWDMPGPVYYRLGKDDSNELPGLDGRFELGRAQMVRQGKDLLLVATGAAAMGAHAAAELLAGQGVECSLLVVPSLRPAPDDDLRAALAAHPAAMTVEAHYTEGGLGSLVCEVAAQAGLGCKVRRCGVSTPPDGYCGSEGYYMQRHGLDAKGLEAAALELLGSLK